VSALSDDVLQARVMEKQPNTIEEALGITGRLEAYENTLKAQATLPSEFSKGESRHKHKHVYTVESEQSHAEQLLQKQFKELRRSLLISEIKDNIRAHRLPRTSMAHRHRPISHQVTQLISRVVVEPPRDTAGAEVEVEVEAVEVVHSKVNHIVMTVRNIAIILEIVGPTHQSRDQTIVHQSSRLSVGH